MNPWGLANATLRFAGLDLAGILAELRHQFYACEIAKGSLDGPREHHAGHEPRAPLMLRKGTSSDARLGSAPTLSQT